MSSLHYTPIGNHTITYLKLWWGKIISNEGVDLHLRIHPLTALAIAAVVGLGGFGLGRVSIPITSPIIRYIPQLAPSPTPNPWKDYASIGIVRYSATMGKFYLETDQGVITLEVPKNIDLTKYIGRRIFAAGQLHITTGVLKVLDTSDLELLPTAVSPIPTVLPTATPTVGENL